MHLNITTPDRAAGGGPGERVAAFLLFGRVTLKFNGDGKAPSCNFDWPDAEHNPDHKVWRTTNIAALQSLFDKAYEFTVHQICEAWFSARNPNPIPGASVIAGITQYPDDPTYNPRILIAFAGIDQLNRYLATSHDEVTIHFLYN